MAHMNHQDMILDVMEYSRIEDHFAVTTPAESRSFLITLGSIILQIIGLAN